MPQEATPLIPFHVEHIVSRQHGGTDDASGLALACDRCNAYKGPNLTSIDPDTGITSRAGALASTAIGLRSHATSRDPYLNDDSLRTHAPWKVATIPL
jgi:hypothetical protein